MSLLPNGINKQIHY